MNNTPLNSGHDDLTSSDSLNHSGSKPWYREFWAWFILSPLIVVVIVSSITVTIAVRNADDRVVDNYYKEGRMINMRLDEDILSDTLSVQANIIFDQPLQELIVQLSISDDFPKALMLHMGHPAQAELDQSIPLKHIAKGRYHSELSGQTFSNRWYLRLAPVYDDTQKSVWRLRGEINFAKTASVIIQPEL
jgi:hypothetical protein